MKKSDEVKECKIADQRISMFLSVAVFLEHIQDFPIAVILCHQVHFIGIFNEKQSQSLYVAVIGGYFLRVAISYGEDELQ